MYSRRFSGAPVIGRASLPAAEGVWMENPLRFAG
jgi:hypothetical protein